MTGFSIPENFPLVELIEQELSNLSIGRHYLCMSFIQPKMIVAGVQKYESGASIEVEAGFELQMEFGQLIEADNSDLATGAASLIQLLGRKITAVSRLPNNELRLEFEGKINMVLTVDSQGYESYHLHISGHSVDVTKEW